MSAVLFKFVPSLFLPGNLVHWPGGGGGVGGPGGQGWGPEHFVGSGPWTTVPEIFKLEIENDDPSRSPGPEPQSSGGGTQPLVHWDEYNTAPLLSCVDRMVSQAPLGSGLNPPRPN